MHTVHAFATRDFNVRMRKYAQCGPRLSKKYYKYHCISISITLLYSKLEWSWFSAWYANFYIVAEVTSNKALLTKGYILKNTADNEHSKLESGL